MKALLLSIVVMTFVLQANAQSCVPIDNRNVGAGGTHATICFFDANNHSLGCLDCQLAGASGWKCGSGFNAVDPFHHATINGGAPCLSPTALPIELVDFSIENTEHSVKINWSTASERNNDYFVLEKSRDGSFWEEVSKIAGAQNSSEVKTYEVTDDDPFNGTSYYKLHQYDINGQNSEIAFESVDFKAYKYLLYPIPVNKNMFLEGEDLEDATISLVNSLGERLNLERSFVGDKLNFDFSGVKNGVYFLLIEASSHTKTERVIVVH